MVMTLIERLEAAEAGSRELDADVHSAAGTVFSRPVTHEDRYYNLLYDPKVVSVFIPEALTPVTTSLDAALALAEGVLPGCSWDAGRVAGGHYARVRSRGTTVPFGPDIVYAHTPALALCIAILKAKEAEK